MFQGNERSSAFISDIFVISLILKIIRYNPFDSSYVSKARGTYHFQKTPGHISKGKTQKIDIDIKKTVKLRFPYLSILWDSSQ